jgi:hypothetical protein
MDRFSCLLTLGTGSWLKAKDPLVMDVKLDLSSQIVVILSAFLYHATSILRWRWKAERLRS